MDSMSLEGGEEDQKQQLIQSLKQQSFRVEETSGGPDCQYEALAHQLSSTGHSQLTPQELRQKARDFLQNINDMVVMMHKLNTHTH